MEFKDYYETLGVERDAKPEDIKKAFRKRARKYHPDVSKEPDAEARMKDINEAFAVLSDPEKRAAYDNIGKGFQSGQDFYAPPDWTSAQGRSDPRYSRAETADFSSFFSELFGSRMDSRDAAQFATRGEDHHVEVALDLEDSYRGALRPLTLRTPTIDERGRVAMAERSLDVQIPKGVYEGQLIRLTGQGSPGMQGGAPGDLYMKVRFRPHPRYRVEGRDVYVTLPVAPWEAALGGSVQVPVPDGTVEVRIPEGSQSGRKLRLKGRGIPSSPPGDLYFVLEVVLPAANTPKARELYETMARELAFNPRQNVKGSS